MIIKAAGMLISNAREYWDNETSVEMAVIEECGELLRAISKMLRKNNDETIDNLKEEIRDNFIGLLMLMQKYGISSSEINHMIDYKLRQEKQ